MYDIDRFIKDRVSVNFESYKEMLLFIECFENKFGKEYSLQPASVENAWQHRKALVFNFNSYHMQMGPDEFHVSHGWKSIKAADLLIFNQKIIEDTLADFLEV